MVIPLRGMNTTEKVLCPGHFIQMMLRSAFFTGKITPDMAVKHLKYENNFNNQPYSIGKTLLKSKISDHYSLFLHR